VETIRLRIKHHYREGEAVLNLISIARQHQYGWYNNKSELREAIEEHFVIIEGDVENWNLLGKRIAVIPGFSRVIYDLTAV
jgi:hypothetical protein